MQNRRRAKLQRLVGFLELPQDIVLDLRRITMLENKQVLVENHKGIIEYTPGKVRLKLNFGELIIEGDELVLGNLHLEQILVEGVIKSLNYDK